MKQHKQPQQATRRSTIDQTEKPIERRQGMKNSLDGLLFASFYRTSSRAIQSRTRPYRNHTRPYTPRRPESYTEPHNASQPERITPSRRQEPEQIHQGKNAGSSHGRPREKQIRAGFYSVSKMAK